MEIGSVHDVRDCDFLFSKHVTVRVVLFFIKDSTATRFNTCIYPLNYKTYFFFIYFFSCVLVHGFCLWTPTRLFMLDCVCAEGEYSSMISESDTHSTSTVQCEMSMSIARQNSTVPDSSIQTQLATTSTTSTTTTTITNNSPAIQNSNHIIQDDLCQPSPSGTMNFYILFFFLLFFSKRNGLI